MYCSYFKQYLAIFKQNYAIQINYSMMKSKTLIFLLCLLSLLLSACATTSDDDFEEDNKTAAALYEEAKSALAQEDYETAIQRLETLEARFPFGKYAQQAQLDMAFAYYKFEEPESATSAANRFIKLYPRHPYVDYAFYLKGLIKFNQGQSFFDKFSEDDQAKRDPEAARKSFLFFSDLVRRYPESKYAADAVERMTFLRNNLALHELFVAQHYMERGAYLAAVNRTKYIIQNYQKSPSTPEALLLQSKAYKKLRLDDLAEDSQRVYDMNFNSKK